MKNLLLTLIVGSLLLVSCESAKEISLNEDGSGVLVSTNDMSGMLGLAKMQGGGGEQLKKLEEQTIDTVFSLNNIVDSLTDFTAEEKQLVSKGSFAVNFNLAEEKCLIKIELPFSEPTQLGRLNTIVDKLMQQGGSKIIGSAADMGGGMPLGNDDIPSGSIDNYYTLRVKKGEIVRELNREKYATKDSDEGMQAMKEMGQFGMGNTTLVINLPSPAKEATGQGVSLSEDKKKVTITSSVEDFFDDGKKLEFIIKY